MNDHSHLKNLVNLGFLVDERVKEKIESLNEEEFYGLIENLKKESIFILNEEVLKPLLAKDVAILKTFKREEIFDIQCFVKKLNDRYAFLQGVLLKKLELSNIVSINKCSDGTASIIGLVKEKEEKNNDFSVVLEDPTGEIRVIVPKKLGEKIALDDVVAVSGRVENKVLFVDKLLFPEVSLKPVVFNKDPFKIAFTDKEVEADYLVFNSKIKDNVKNKEYEITNPCIFKIEDVVFLLALDFDPLDALKKRYISIENSDFLIEPSPDIVLTNKEINTNYKGISIISKNKIIDIKTREASDI